MKTVLQIFRQDTGPLQTQFLLAKPAFPDAMEYKEGGTWVQDWLLMTGVHKETGIVTFEDGVKYTPDETKKLNGCTDDEIKKIHAAKKIIGGSVE